VSGSGISWALCKSAPHSRQPWQHPTTLFFTGRMSFLPPNQQHQSTEGKPKQWRRTGLKTAGRQKHIWGFGAEVCTKKTNSWCAAEVQIYSAIIFSALTLLVGRQERHLACKKTEWWGAGIVVCLEQGADLHIAQLMPLPLTVSCFTKIHIGFTFLVPTQLGSPGKMAIKRVCVFCIFGALLEAVLRCKIFCECIRCSFCR